MYVIRVCTGVTVFIRFFNKEAGWPTSLLSSCICRVKHAECLDVKSTDPTHERLLHGVFIVLFLSVQPLDLSLGFLQGLHMLKHTRAHVYTHTTEPKSLTKLKFSLLKQPTLQIQTQYLVTFINNHGWMFYLCQFSLVVSRELQTDLLSSSMACPLCPFLPASLDKRVPGSPDLLLQLKLVVLLCQPVRLSLVHT